MQSMLIYTIDYFSTTCATIKGEYCMVGKTNTSAAKVQNKIMYYTKIMMLIRHIKDGFTLYTGLVMCRAATSNLKQTVKICSLHLNIVLESGMTLCAHQYMYSQIVEYLCCIVQSCMQTIIRSHLHKIVHGSFVVTRPLTTSYIQHFVPDCFTLSMLLGICRNPQCEPGNLVHA